MRWCSGDGGDGGGDDDDDDDDDDPDEVQRDDDEDGDDLPLPGRNFPGRFLPAGELYLSLWFPPRGGGGIFSHGLLVS